MATCGNSTDQPELDSGGFVFPDPNSRSVWGHENRLRIGLAPAPNGVIRIYAGFLGQEFPQAVNFIAIEPSVVGQRRRDQSELLESNVRPNQKGLLFWASNTLKSSEETPKKAWSSRGTYRLVVWVSGLETSLEKWSPVDENETNAQSATSDEKSLIDKCTRVWGEAHIREGAHRAIVESKAALTAAFYGGQKLQN